MASREKIYLKNTIKKAAKSLSIEQKSHPSLQVVVDMEGDEKEAETENHQQTLEQPSTVTTKSIKSQLSLPFSENPRQRSLKRSKRLLASRSSSHVEPSSTLHDSLQDELDLNIHLKNVGEVAAMALLKHRMERGSITSADVPLAFRRNATVLRDIKNIALYHQHMKKSVDQKSTKSFYKTSGDSRTSPCYRSEAWSSSQLSLPKNHHHHFTRWNPPNQQEENSNNKNHV